MALERTELPAGWQWTTLGAVADPTRNRVNPQNYPELPFVGMEHVESHTRRVLETVPAATMRSTAEQFQPGDVLYGRMRPYLNKVFLADFHGLCSGEFIPFRKTAGVNSKYLLYFLNSWGFVSFASHLTEGDRPRVDFAQLASYPFPLPPRPEQDMIVDIIETQFSRVDAAEAALKRVQANLRRYRAAVLKAACEGRLVPTEAELAQAEGRTYEPAAALLERILAERQAQWQAEHPGKKYKEPAGPDVSALPELPEGWCWATVEQLASHRRYSLAIGPFGSSLKVSDYRESGVPLVFVRNIRAAKFSNLDDHFVTKEKAVELKAHTVTGGDILITKMGEPPGDACMYPLAATPGAIITADCIKLALCDECVGHTQLFVHFLNAAPVRDQVNHITQGVAQKKVSLERYRTIALPLPPLLEQDRIANAIETLLPANDVLVDDVAANLKRAERLRQAILVSAFSGRLAFDPQDDALQQLQFEF